MTSGAASAIRSASPRRSARSGTHVPNGVRVAVVAIVGVAWALTLIGAGWGEASVLHHHALIVGGPPLWIGVPAFLVAWLVMVAAMMLPASAPAIRAMAGRAGRRGHPMKALAAFLGAYALIWAGFGLFAFGGDVVLHHVVDPTPWLAMRPWIIGAAVLVIAGAFEISGPKQQFLAVCRHPLPHIEAGGSAFRIGLVHGLACLGCSWALMLVMFAAGVASLPWMIGLAAVMAYQGLGRHGERTVRPFGATLLLVALLLLMAPLALPTWLVV
jgi:predicted metal-binding membrane protein